MPSSCKALKVSIDHHVTTANDAFDDVHDDGGLAQTNCDGQHLM